MHSQIHESFVRFQILLTMTNKILWKFEGVGYFTAEGAKNGIGVKTNLLSLNERQIGFSHQLQTISALSVRGKKCCTHF